MSKWQPIETAPKRKEILLYEPEVKRPRQDLGLRARFVVSTYPTPYPRKATHWMPLPGPPEAKS